MNRSKDEWKVKLLELEGGCACLGLLSRKLSAGFRVEPGAQRVSEDGVSTTSKEQDRVIHTAFRA